MSIDVSQEDINKLSVIIEEETGNHIQEKNHSMISSRIRGRLYALSISDMNKYWEYYKEHEKEERKLISGLMTTHYTFFFREFLHFDALEHWIESKIESIKKNFKENKKPLKVWSAAGSTGHEAYSLGIFLDQVLLQKHGVDYEILCTDIDSNSLKVGANGVYKLKDVNTIPKKYLDGYWRVGSGDLANFAAIKKDIKEKIKFEQLNLLNVSSWENKDTFDVIFCRNIFIYFTQDNVKKIALSLKEKLNPDGLFISGVSEALRFPEWDLEVLNSSVYYNGKVDLMESTSSKGDDKDSKYEYKVLCVDDSKTMQSIMKKIFKDDPNCVGVEVANHGGHAKEILDNNPYVYDLITLDINMPEVDGVKFLQDFYDKEKHPPVVMVSSVNRQDNDLATKAMALGAVDYIEKPNMNNLDDSKEEIITKTKFVVQEYIKNKPKLEVDNPDETSSKDVKEDQKVNADTVEKDPADIDLSKFSDDSSNNFDEDFTRSIELPNLDKCLRVVNCSEDGVDKIKLILQSQSSEHHSPANMFIVENNHNLESIRHSIESITNKKVCVVNKSDIIDPETIYLCSDYELLVTFLKKDLQCVSLQFINFDIKLLYLVMVKIEPQLLLDESSSHKVEPYILDKVKFSDTVPVTSFSSLSVEFFANLRDK